MASDEARYRYRRRRIVNDREVVDGWDGCSLATGSGPRLMLPRPMPLFYAENIEWVTK